MTTEELVDLLATHRTIGEAPRVELNWIATHGTCRHLQAGEVVSRATDVVNELYIILSGRLAHIRFLGTGYRRVINFQGGDIGGLLPYSRLRISGGDTVAEEPADVVALTRNDFPGLILNCPVVTETLVHVMTDRTRHFTSTELRDEKMISLGKLAAGLAHELNNPASAALRDAKSLASVLKTAREAAHALSRAGLTESQLAELERVQNLCVSDATYMLISGIALADREEEIAAWLRSRGVHVSAVEDLARTAITTEALDRIASALQGIRLDVALRWIAADCAAQALSLDIERAATRIHSLVASVMGFTHLDKARDEGPVDIPAGLSDTVALLDGKARAKSVTITLGITPPLPHVRGLSAEINQVWMNLIDNAIDAAPASGHIEVTATHEGPAVAVHVVDNGPGIPPEIKGNIFDPFFTTKSAGEGTGLGLDIVRRIVEWHNGQIDAASEPGRTEFVVRLPCMGKDAEPPQSIP